MMGWFRRRRINYGERLREFAAMDTHRTQRPSLVPMAYIQATEAFAMSDRGLGARSILTGQLTGLGFSQAEAEELVRSLSEDAQ